MLCLCISRMMRIFKTTPAVPATHYRWWQARHQPQGSTMCASMNYIYREIVFLSFYSNVTIPNSLTFELCQSHETFPSKPAQVYEFSRHTSTSLFWERNNDRPSLYINTSYSSDPRRNLATHTSSNRIITPASVSQTSIDRYTLNDSALSAPSTPHTTLPPPWSAT